MKNILVILLMFFLVFTGRAQEHDDEKIKSLKTAYITKTLELSSAEAEKFWPIYNKFEKETDALYDTKWCGVKNGLNTLEYIDEKYADSLLTEYLNLKEESVLLKKEFVKELKQVISPKKILTLKKAEHDFHKILLEKYGKR